MEKKNKNTVSILTLDNGMRIRIDKNSDPRNIEMFRSTKINPKPFSEKQ